MTTVSRYTDGYVVPPGSEFGQYDGVCYVEVSGADGVEFGSGALLAGSGGQAVLTAAHVAENAQNARVTFETPFGSYRAPVENILMHEGYDKKYFSNDLALLWLEDPVPPEIPAYELYRDGAEPGSVVTMVGYGATGLGDTGFTEPPGPRTRVYNEIEVTNADPGVRGIGIQGPPGSQILADFDSGSLRNDAFGNFLGLWDGGLGPVEGSTAPGDSGGPAFINGQLAGVTSFGYRPEVNGFSTDVTSRVDASFGEIMSWQRASYYQSWIDEGVAMLQRADAAPASYGSADPSMMALSEGLGELIALDSMSWSDSDWEAAEARPVDSAMLPLTASREEAMDGAGQDMAGLLASLVESVDAAVSSWKDDMHFDSGAELSFEALANAFDPFGGAAAKGEALAPAEIVADAAEVLAGVREAFDLPEMIA